jgi:hypothetical protein
MKPTEANVHPRKKPILIPVLVIIPLMGLGLYIAPNLLDTTPPTLTMSGLDRDQRYCGALKLRITAMDGKPGMSSLTVQVDDAPPTPLHFVEGESISWALQTALFADGLHTVSVTALDRSLHKNRTQHTLPFYIDNTPPALHVPTETLRVGQGKTLALFLQTDEPLSHIEGELFDKVITFYPTGSKNLYRSFVGIGVTFTRAC